MDCNTKNMKAGDALWRDYFLQWQYDLFIHYFHQNFSAGINKVQYPHMWFFVADGGSIQYTQEGMSKNQ